MKWKNDTSSRWRRDGCVLQYGVLLLSSKLGSVGSTGAFSSTACVHGAKADFVGKI